MKTLRERTAAIAALLGMVAVTGSYGFDDSNIFTWFDTDPPNTGWTAQADAFYGSVGGVGPTYWGWTSAHYYWYGHPRDLNWVNAGYDGSAWSIPTGYAGYVWNASYCYAEKYWLDADWVGAQSYVQTIDSGQYMFAAVEIWD